MEYVPGGSLDRFWRSHGANIVPIETTVEIIRQVCRGLAVAHASLPPIIHRDIKPQNILVGYENDGLRARVSDFGLAKKVNPLTMLATAAGTLNFKPPETFSKTKADSCAADVWALGVSLYLMLSDQLPFEIDQDLGWSNKSAFQKELIPPSSLNADIDIVLERIVLKCLAMEPNKRYPTARELLDALDDWKKPTPSKDAKSKKSISSELSKNVLGSHSSMDQEAAHRLARMAISRAKEEGCLVDAADMMEEAFNKSPSLRQKYANQVRLWRCGISM